METDYERRLRQVVEEVQAHDSMRIDSSEQGVLGDYLGDAEHALELISRAEELPLPVELTRNFHRHSSLELAWRAVDPYETVGGEFCLVHIGNALLAGTPLWLTGMAASDQERQRLEQFRVFDTQPTGGTGTCAALRLTGSSESAEVWYFEMTQGSMMLDIRYGDYLDVLLRTRGLYYWQYLFAEPGSAEPGMSTVLPALRGGLDFLTEAFPGDDFSDLTARLETRERSTDNDA